MNIGWIGPKPLASLIKEGVCTKPYTSLTNPRIAQSPSKLVTGSLEYLGLLGGDNKHGCTFLGIK